MRFRVPQFIEMEDKIVGPLTLKQFFYLGGAALLLLICWFSLRLAAFILIAIPIGLLALALAFYKVQGRPLATFLGSWLKYSGKPKIYIWKK